MKVSVREIQKRKSDELSETAGRKKHSLYDDVKKKVTPTRVRGIMRKRVEERMKRGRMLASIMRNCAFHGDKQKDETRQRETLIASAIDVGDCFNLRRSPTCI